MGVRIGFGAAIVCAAIVLAVATGPVVPAHAADSALSYNEITKVITKGSPAPGSYSNGSFDADWAAATQKKAGGLFGMIKNAMSMMSNGIPSSLYYLNNMERNDDVKDATGTITIPAKREIIHLDYGQKTYWIATPNPAQETMETPPPQPQPQPQQSMAPPQPGTAKVAVTVTTTSLGSMNLGGVDTNGYQMTFKVVSTEATGSCKNGTFGTAMTEFVSSYPQPELRNPNPTMKPPPKMENPLLQPGLATVGSPGCKPKVSATVKNGPTAPSGRLVIWEMLTFNLAGGATGQQAGGISTVIERGDVKQLGSGDSGLFDIPAGFKQVAPQ